MVFKIDSSPVSAASGPPGGQRLGFTVFSGIFRPMNEADIDRVLEIIQLAMNVNEAQQAMATFRFHFACAQLGLDDGRSYQVLDHDGDVIGIAGLHHYAWGPPENVWLAWFAVEPEHWGQRLGRAMLDMVTNLATQFGYMKLYIETYSTPEFSRARNLYDASGFRLAGAVSSYLPSGGDMVVYCKDLTQHA